MKHGACLHDLNAAQVADGSFDKAVVGVGATEYHGPHLPYGADTLVAYGACLAGGRAYAAHAGAASYRLWDELAPSVLSLDALAAP